MGCGAPGGGGTVDGWHEARLRPLGVLEGAELTKCLPAFEMEISEIRTTWLCQA